MENKVEVYSKDEETKTINILKSEEVNRIKSNINFIYFSINH